MKAPLSASKQQLEAFKRILQHENSRPVQPLNSRFVIE
jgi:carbonic anhydrase